MRPLGAPGPQGLGELFDFVFLRLEKLIGPGNERIGFL